MKLVINLTFCKILLNIPEKIDEMHILSLKLTFTSFPKHLSFQNLLLDSIGCKTLSDVFYDLATFPLTPIKKDSYFFRSAT